MKFTKLAAVLFFMKHKETTKMVAWGSYHRTPRTSGASPPLSSQGQHGGAAVSKGQGHRGYKGSLFFGAAGIFSFSPKARASGRCSQKLSWLLESPSTCQHRVRSLLLHPVLCLMGWWGFPRAWSSASTQRPDGPCSLRS